MASYDLTRSQHRLMSTPHGAACIAVQNLPYLTLASISREPKLKVTVTYYHNEYFKSLSWFGIQIGWKGSAME